MMTSIDVLRPGVEESRVHPGIFQGPCLSGFITTSAWHQGSRGQLTQIWGQSPLSTPRLSSWASSKESLVWQTKSAGAGREPGALLTNLWYLSNLLCLSWCHQVSQQCPCALGNKLKAVQRYLDHLCDCWAGEMEV